MMLSARPGYLWWLLVPLTPLVSLGGSRVETVCIAVGGVLAVAAAVLPRRRAVFAQGRTGVLGLVFHVDAADLFGDPYFSVF